jgi:hypothetical protein
MALSPKEKNINNNLKRSLYFWGFRKRKILLVTAGVCSSNVSEPENCLFQASFEKQIRSKEQSIPVISKTLKSPRFPLKTGSFLGHRYLTFSNFLKTIVTYI